MRNTCRRPSDRPTWYPPSAGNSVSSCGYARMPTILVIEDDEDVRGLLLRHLVAAEFDVQEAANGKTGLAAYRQQQSDLVITDIVMPETEGLETIRELRRLNPEVKIIAMTGAVACETTDPTHRHQGRSQPPPGQGHPVKA